MRVSGLIIGLDLGIRTGVAFGCPGKRPRSEAVHFKAPGDPRSVCFANLIAYLQVKFTTEKPELVAKEQMLALQAFAKIGNAEATVRIHAGMHAIVEGMCGRFGVPWLERSDGTIRRHFIGRSNMGERQATKAAVIARCHLLGILPRDCSDDNRADALAVHDWACATFGRAPASIKDLHFFGETAGSAV